MWFWSGMVRAALLALFVSLALCGSAAARTQTSPRIGRARVVGSSKWATIRRYNAWVRSLGGAEQEALARDFYAELWTELEGYLGDAGQPPPLLVFVPGALLESEGDVADLWMSSTCIREVELPEHSILPLALKGYGRIDAAEVIAHEWRHVFQNAALFADGRDRPHDEQPLERDADAFASAAIKAMDANRELKRSGKPPRRPYVYRPGDISENLGKDPTKIVYPLCSRPT